MLIVDATNCILYELYAAYPQTDGTWHAGSGAIFNLNGNQLRPAGWTSADAAGLPILSGLVRYDEIQAGAILHAIRFTVKRRRRRTCGRPVTTPRATPPPAFRPWGRGSG